MSYKKSSVTALTGFSFKKYHISLYLTKSIRHRLTLLIDTFGQNKNFNVILFFYAGEKYKAKDDLISRIL